MVYIIFRNNKQIAKVKPLDTSELLQKQQQEDRIKLDFVLVEYVDIKIGDYIYFKKTNQKYYLNKAPRVEESPKNYKYECYFEGPIHELRKTKIFLDTQKTEGGFYRDYKFPLSGNAETFLLFIVDALNRNGGNYTAGAYKSTATQNVEFNNWNGFEAINQLSALLNFEWYLEGNVLNFDSNTSETGFIFQVGRKSGFTKLTRARVEREDVETVVYGYGSTQNLPPRTAEEGITYDSDLLTENRLSFEGVDGESKLTNNTEVYGSIESIQEFDQIHPEFTGVVSAISSDVRTFTDDSIDFDINEYLLPGIFPKIKFLTGKLIGLTFNISFDNDTKEITMDYYSDESGQYPNDIIHAEVGDQYKLFDLMLPEAYIQDAQQRLEEATQAYLDEQSNPLESYTGVVDREYIESGQIELNLGNLVRIISFTFDIDNLYVIKELRQSITDPNKYAITFGDTLPLSLLNSLKISNFTTQQSIYNVQKNSVTSNQITNVIGEDLTWQPL
jgi:hypothetical protein